MLAFVSDGTADGLSVAPDKGPVSSTLASLNIGESLEKHVRSFEMDVHINDQQLPYDEAGMNKSIGIQLRNSIPRAA